MSVSLPVTGQRKEDLILSSGLFGSDHSQAELKTPTFPALANHNAWLGAGTMLSTEPCL